ncbi:hypothetical protein Salat_1198000 [Sesamum alatum]|uniref:Uncharacterized protein n=1 Tax=Sesamum alatum TaxID=300844 RepID=A0AAE1YEV6_9LAMI|nr:hypothetical protein Salat_1198000 [Sesamum alatum]
MYLPILGPLHSVTQGIILKLTRFLVGLMRWPSFKAERSRLLYMEEQQLSLPPTPWPTDPPDLFTASNPSSHKLGLPSGLINYSGNFRSGLFDQTQILEYSSENAVVYEYLVLEKIWDDDFSISNMALDDDFFVGLEDFTTPDDEDIACPVTLRRTCSCGFRIAQPPLPAAVHF